MSEYYGFVMNEDADDFNAFGLQEFSHNEFASSSAIQRNSDHVVDRGSCFSPTISAYGLLSITCDCVDEDDNSRKNRARSSQYVSYSPIQRNDFQNLYSYSSGSVFDRVPKA